MTEIERIDCAIEDLKLECANYSFDNNCGEKEQCEKCYIPTALEALEKDEKYQWHAVPESLPDIYRHVFIQWSNYSSKGIKRTYFDFGFINESGEFESSNNYRVFKGTVESWMPLPEPYKVDGDEE